MTFYIDPGTGSMLFTKRRFKPSGRKAELNAAYLVRKYEELTRK